MGGVLSLVMDVRQHAVSVQRFGRGRGSSEHLHCRRLRHRRGVGADLAGHVGCRVSGGVSAGCEAVLPLVLLQQLLSVVLRAGHFPSAAVFEFIYKQWTQKRLR